VISDEIEEVFVNSSAELRRLAAPRAFLCAFQFCRFCLTLLSVSSFYFVMLYFCCSHMTCFYILTLPLFRLAEHIYSCELKMSAFLFP